MKTYRDIRSLRTSLTFWLLVAATGLPFLLLAQNAQADMCFNGSGQNDDHRDGGHGTGGSAGSDGAVSGNGLRKRNFGVGLVTAASMGGFWLLLRRPEQSKQNHRDSS